MDFANKNCSWLIYLTLLCIAPLPRQDIIHSDENLIQCQACVLYGEKTVRKLRTEFKFEQE
jgi:hypothetical protein